MNVGCKTLNKNDVIKGLKLVSDPYKIGNDRNYRAMVKCVLCDSPPYEIVLSEIKRHIFDGCGCQKNRSNSTKWKSFKDWCVENNRQDLLDLWDYELNGKVPDQISCCTADSYYFRCPEGRHDSTLHNISCVTTKYKNKKMCLRCNSFAQHTLDKFGKDVLDIYWDYTKNTADPWLIPHASKDHVWIKCIHSFDHGSYPIRPHLFLKGIGCPVCADEQKCSKLQEKVNYYLSNILHFDVRNERKCSLIATNPKNGYKLPYDNEITVGCDNLIIEVHGVQHYDVDNGWICKTAKKYNLSPEKVLADLQWRDEYKRQYALSQGYYYLAIPYWTENDESYKTLIDQKIQEILNNTKLIA